MPLPSKWYVSPMKRAGETCGIEWGWLFEESKGKGKGHGVPATVIEVNYILWHVYLGVLVPDSHPLLEPARASARPRM